MPNYRLDQQGDEPMSELAERFDKIARAFTERVDAVATNMWDNPTPCEGWRARDIVRHLIEWVPSFFQNTAGLPLHVTATADTDPAAAWHQLRSGLHDLLRDPTVADREFDAPMGRMTIAAAIDMIVTGDIFVHTWDLARATGLDERLDPIEVHRMFEGMEPHDAALRASGHYGPRIPVADDADEQSKLLAFMGRTP